MWSRVFLMTSFLTHTCMGHPHYAKMESCGVTSTSCGLSKKTCIHKTKYSKLILMHCYFVIKFQAVNGNADTCWGKRKCISKRCIKMESAGLNYTHTHTSSHTRMHKHPHAHTQLSTNTLQQGSRSSLIVNQELFHCNSCTL